MPAPNLLLLPSNTTTATNPTHHHAPPRNTTTALFLDLLSSSGSFTQKEADDIIAVGYLNGLFVLARSIGLIGHSLDQKRLQQPLYRHAWEDVLYMK